MNRQLPLGLDRRPGARFDNFCAGPNGNVVQTLQEAALQPRDAWIGLSGSAGKSHLLAATAVAVNEHGGRALYAHGPMIVAARDPAVMDGLEETDLLCLDDLDALLGDRAWEEALFHLLNRLRSRQTGLLFAATRPARRLNVELPDLASRLVWGVHLHLEPLDDAAKGQLLRLRARERGLSLDEATCSYILRRLPRDVPSLVSTLDRLADATLAAKRRLTPRFVGEWLAVADGSQAPD